MPILFPVNNERTNLFFMKHNLDPSLLPSVSDRVHDQSTVSISSTLMIMVISPSTETVPHLRRDLVIKN